MSDIDIGPGNGLEFLKITKSDVNFKVTPVVVLTTSDSDQNIAGSYKLGVAGYIIKPIDYKQFVDAMRILDTYWTQSKLPSDN